MESSTTRRSFSLTWLEWSRKRRGEGPPIPRDAELELPAEPIEERLDPALEESGVDDARPGGCVVDAGAVRRDAPRFELLEQRVIGRDFVSGHRRSGDGPGFHRLEGAAERLERALRSARRESL